MVDVAQLAKDLVLVLGPYLPYLSQAGGSLAEESGKQLAGATWAGITDLWEKLFPAVEAKPGAQEAIQDVATAPDAEGAKNALVWQLTKLLNESPKLAAELAALLDQARPAPPSGNVAIASGHGSIAIGGNMDRSQAKAGDHRDRTE